MSDYPPRGGPGPDRPQERGGEPVGQRLEHAGTQASDVARQAQERMQDWSRRLYRGAERGRVLTAEALSRAANTLRASSTDADPTARRFADNLERGATYLRQTDLEGMRHDLVGLVRQYPGQAVGAAFLVGYLLGQRRRRR
jgi:hypothetical protein